MRGVQITRFGGPEVMDIVELPEPTPGDGQKLYEVSSAGVNFADTHHWESANRPVGSAPRHPRALIRPRPIAGDVMSRR